MWSGCGCQREPWRSPVKSKQTQYIVFEKQDITKYGKNDKRTEKIGSFFSAFIQKNDKKFMQFHTNKFQICGLQPLKLQLK